MSDINPQVTPASQENTQGISIDNLLNPITNPITEETPIPENPITPPQGTPDVNLPTNLPPDPVTPPTTPPVSAEDTDDDGLERLLHSPNGLSAEDLQLRNNIFTTFGAVNSDDKGNLLDANNRVVLSRENLDKYILDGDLLLDNTGNQVNELGEIIKPVGEVQASNSFINTAKDAIEKEYGFSFLDATGQPKRYADTSEGRIELIKDAVKNSHLNAVSSFLDARPDLKEMFFHLEGGGTFDNFVNQSFDYSSVDVSSLSREQKLNYIKSSYEKQGLKNFNSTMKLLETASDEALTESTSDALLALNKITEETRSQAEIDYQARVQQEQQEINTYWDGIKGRITSGKVGDITIPNDEKDKFFTYLASVVDSEGRSQEQIDMAKEDPNFNLMVSYLRFKKLDLSALVNIRARSNRLHNARERFNIHQPAPINNPAPSATQRPNGIISLEDL